MPHAPSGARFSRGRVSCQTKGPPVPRHYSPCCHVAADPIDSGSLVANSETIHKFFGGAHLVSYWSRTEGWGRSTKPSEGSRRHGGRGPYPNRMSMGEVLKLTGASTEAEEGARDDVGARIDIRKRCNRESRSRDGVRSRVDVPTQIALREPQASAALLVVSRRTRKSGRGPIPEESDIRLGARTRLGFPQLVAGCLLAFISQQRGHRD